MELTILLPCLNEEATLEGCILEANNFIEKNSLVGEILVADNGSSDGSVDLAKKLGASVISVPQKGYGAALQAGIKAANGRYIIMADADGTYDLEHLELFLEMLRKDYDLVMGNRYRGGIEKEAMPFLHRYLGTPIISWLGRVLYHNKIGDYNCGLRGFSRSSVLELDLQASGMEYASEMIVRASQMGLKMAEVPTVLRRAKVERTPHLNTWKDGWRHLRVLLGMKKQRNVR